MASVSVLILPYIFILHLFVGSSFECLYEGFYAKSCPKLFSIIKPVVEEEIERDNRMGASILRLFFHDCFVNGCDGSILLADTPTSPGEQHALPNNGSIRGLKVIEKIKTAVEKACPGIVSCADILAIAARDSVTILGGPSWKVKLGRRDSTTANGTLANTDIPSPTSNLSILITKFAAKSLSIKDMVALSGAHTIGLARCVSFRSHIYNDSNINSNFASIRKKDCPSGSGGTNLASLDFQTPTTFDNSYYKDLINQRGLMHSDQELFNNGPTDSLVLKYSESKGTFHSDFVKAMIKMGHVTPLSGSKGEIRKVCSKIN